MSTFSKSIIKKLAFFIPLPLAGVVLAYFTNDSWNALIAAGSIILSLLMLYLYLWNFKAFLTAFVFLIPMSVPFSFGENVISLPSEMLLVFLAFFVLIRLIFFDKIKLNTRIHPLSVLLYSGLIWMIISSAFSTMPAVSMKRTLIIGMYVIVFYTMLSRYLEDIRFIRRLFIAYSTGLIIPILNTLYAHAGSNFDMTSAFMVTTPFFPEHTIYAACLTVSFVFLIAIKKKKLEYYTIYPLIILIGIGIFYSFSRASWISLIPAILIYLNYTFRPQIWLKAAILSIGIVLLFLNLNKIYDEFEQNREVGYKGDIKEHLQSLTNITNDASNAERINRWFCTIDMFKDKPLIGFGPGTYQFQYGIYQRREWMTRISTFHGDGGNAHSEYLNTLSEQGLPGLLILLFLIIIIFRTANKLIINHKEVDVRNLSLSILMALSTFFTHSLVNSFMDVDKAAFLVYAGLAALVGMEKRNEGLINTDELNELIVDRNNLIN